MSRISKVILITMALYLQGCVSTTRIVSSTPGAKVYVNGEYAGVTPYKYEDSKIFFSETSIKLQKKGYKPFKVILRKNERFRVGTFILGMFTGGIPWLWVMGYKPEHTYELERNSSTDE